MLSIHCYPNHMTPSAYVVDATACRRDPKEFLDVLNGVGETAASFSTTSGLTPSIHSPS